MLYVLVPFFTLQNTGFSEIYEAGDEQLR